MVALDKNGPAQTSPLGSKTSAWVNETLGDERAFLYPAWLVDLADAHYAISIDNAEHKLGWTPRRSLRATLPKMIESLLTDPERWYRENDLAWTEALEESLATLRRLR